MFRKPSRAPEDFAHSQGAGYPQVMHCPDHQLYLVGRISRTFPYQSVIGSLVPRRRQCVQLALPANAGDVQSEDEAVMAIDQLVRPLLGVELFQGLKPLQITEIARRADRIVFRPGDVIVAEDTTGDAAILIVAGEATRVSGPGMAGDVEPVQPGSLVGEMAMLVDTVHSSTVVARSAVRALRISRAELLEQMEADPALAEHFVACISGRLSRLAADLRAVDAALDQTSRDVSAARQSAQTYH